MRVYMCICVYVYMCIYTYVYILYPESRTPNPESRKPDPEGSGPIVYFIVCARVVIALVVGLPLFTIKV